LPIFITANTDNGNHAVIRKVRTVNCAGLEFQLSPGIRLININDICRRFGDKNATGVLAVRKQ
jgi:hypothetical protein